jgi:hypothetical protein
LRVADTIVGVGVGLGASWITTRLTFAQGA